MSQKKKYHKYDVYYVGYGEGCYAEEYCRQYVGTTYAVSPKQACSRVRYNTRTKEQPHGGYHTYSIGDILEEGSVTFTYEAVLAE